MSWRIAASFALITACEYGLGIVGFRAFGDISARADAILIVALGLTGLVAAAACVAFGAPRAPLPSRMLAGLLFAAFHVVPALSVAVALSFALHGLNAAQIDHATATGSLLGWLLAIVGRGVTVAVGVATLLVWLGVVAYAAICTLAYPLALPVVARFFART